MLLKTQRRKTLIRTRLCRLRLIQIASQSARRFQVLGKGSKAGPKPLTHTWSLAATYDPNFDLNVIGRLTVTAPDGQKRQFPIDVLF
jgi:hypothetical protein